MKYLIILFIALGVLFVSCEKDNDNNSNNPVNDSILFGAGYPNDVFYSLKNGEILNTARNKWDIGFRTGIRSSSILINSGAGVELYEISKDTNDFYTTVDTSGLSSKVKLNNSVTDWEMGAFSANHGSDVFDYGWGSYDMQSHNLYGSSSYFIKTADGSYKKILIREKNSMEQIYYFIFSDVGGSNSYSVVLDLKLHNDKEFVYYSLSSNDIVDDQPAKAEWDLWFTKYVDPAIGRSVTGVLVNPNAKAMKITGVAPASADTTMGSFSSEPGVIGYDWKTFDYNSNSYSVVNNLTHFIKTADKELYRLTFKKFDLTTGKVVFEKEKK